MAATASWISVDWAVKLSLLPSSGEGEFGGATGRSSVDPAPLVSTEPKRRSLGAVVALRDRGRKLYPGAGTSEAEADFSNSRVSMDYLTEPLIYETFNPN